MNERWTTVKLADVPASPWRNGGGVTRELAAWPPTGEWSWRMSVAEVGQSGPFSTFDGVDRWFAVLEGAGVVLGLEGKAHILTAGDAPFFFDGAAATDCELVAGRTQDFNLMVRAGGTVGAPSRMVRIGKDFSVSVNAIQTIAIYANGAGATVRFDDEVLQLAAHSLAWRRITRQTVVAVQAADALWMEIPE